jgi:hypothetical protein
MFVATNPPSALNFNEVILCMNNKIIFAMSTIFLEQQRKQYQIQIQLEYQPKTMLMINQAIEIT